MLGATFDCRNRFKVSTVWGSNSSHWLIGKLFGTPDSTEMKCPLNVWIARSAAFRLCMSAGVNSTLHLFSRIASFNSSGASLSRMCQFGLTAPVAFHRLKIFWYASVSAFAFRDCNGSASMKFPLTQPPPLCTCFLETK